MVLNKFSCLHLDFFKPVSIREANSVNTVPVDVLAPIGTRPSAATLLTSTDTAKTFHALPDRKSVFNNFFRF